MNTPAPRSSIAAHLLLVAVTAALPLCALVAYEFYDRMQSATEDAQEQSRNMAQSLAFDTARFIARRKAVLDTLAQSPQVKSLDPDACDPSLPDFLHTVTEAANLLTLDAQGQVVCSVLPLPSSAPRAVDPQHYLSQALRTGAFTVGRPAQGFISGRWVVTLAQPIVDEDGIRKGVIAVAIDLLKFSATRNVSGMGGMGVAGIIDASGTVVARSVDAPKWVGMASSEFNTTRDALLATQSTGVAKGHDGVERLYAMNPVVGTDWHAFVGLPLDEMLEPGRRHAITGAVLAMLVLVLSGVLSFFMARRISRPIRQLDGVVRQAGRGELQVRLSPSGPREIAEVTEEFNAMLVARQDIERRLREAEALYRGLFESSVSGVAVMQAGHCVLVNPAAGKILGAPVEEVLQTDCASRIAPQDRDTFERFQAEMMDHPEPTDRRCTVHVVCPDGAHISVEFAVVPLMWQGEPASMLMFTDISERLARERIERETLRLDAVSQMTAGLAHEFNSLLTITIGNLDEIGERLRGDDDVAQLQRKSLDAALRCADLTRDLLAVAGLRQLKATSCDLNVLVKQALPALLAEAGAHMVLHLDLAPAPVWALLDPQGLTDVLCKLVRNARESMRLAPHDRTVVLRTRMTWRAGQHGMPGGPIALALIEAEDNGVGMPESVRERAFEPFFTTKHRTGGAGLGLALVYGYATQLGGAVAILSTPGHGTTVRLHLLADLQAYKNS